MFASSCKIMAFTFTQAEKKQTNAKRKGKTELEINETLVKAIIEETLERRVSETEFRDFISYLEDDVEEWIKQNVEAYKDIWAGEIPQ